MKKAKKNFEKKLAMNIKQDSKSFYSYVRSKSKAKVQISSLKNDSGDTLNNDFEIATCLNTFFGSVFTHEDSRDIPDVTDMRISDDDECSDVQFSENDVLMVLNKLKADKSPGPDDLLPRLLMEIKLSLIHI